MNTYREALQEIKAGTRTQHFLKCWPAYFKRIKSGEKTFEVRRDDRGFQNGDVLDLHEWCPDRLSGLGETMGAQIAFTGDSVQALVTYVLRGGQFGIEPGYVVMGIKLLEPGE